MSRSVPDALHRLADLLRSGLTLRQALLVLPEELSGEVRVDVERVARKVALGNSIPEALSGTGSIAHLAPGIALHLGTGIDLAAWIDREADALEERHAFLESARAASSGASLSARMVAGLPLLFVPLSPASRAPFTDSVGLTLLVMGIVLTTAGLTWIGRLVPRPPGEGIAVLVAFPLASLLRAGHSLGAALGALSRVEGPVRSTLVDAANRHRLGLCWPDALSTAGRGLTPVANAIRRAERFGLPIAEVLQQFGRAELQRDRREFDRRIKRAPVLMVLPLSCCILPAYVLLALGPYLRGVGG